VSRLVLVILMMAAAASAVLAYKDPEQLARATDSVSEMLRKRGSPGRAVQIARAQGGEFALRAKINGVDAPMVIDTGATSVVLTYETAKAAGLPLVFLGAVRGPHHEP